MDIIHFFLDIILHLDKHLAELMQKYGTWTYAILFLIVFLETGVVITPFLPGDSLLFAAGALCAAGGLNPVFLFLLLTGAALIGDNLNYWIGRSFGPKVFERDGRFLKKAYLDKTRAYYEKHGGKTVILARFLPIVRTFSPFVAGVGAMTYPRFLAFSVVAAILWTGIFIPLGYFFGNLPIVKENFHIAVFGIIGISILPMVIEFLKHRAQNRAVRSA